MATAKKAPVEEQAETTTEAAAEVPTVDRVASVSYRADGTPDQTDGFEVIATEDAESE